MSRRTQEERRRNAETIIAYRAEGFGFPEIARKLGLSLSMVRRDYDAYVTPGDKARALGNPDAIIRNGRRLVRGGRASKTSISGRYQTVGTIGTPVPPSSANEYGRIFNLIENWRGLRDPNSIMLLLARHSPEVSNAWRTLVLMTVGGWEVEAIRPGSDGEKDDVAQAVLEERLNEIGDRHGSLHGLFGEFVTNAAFRGGMCGEAILRTRSADRLMDIVAIDPNVVRFRPVTDDQYGQTWELGQPIRDALDGWLSLDIPTIKYLPIDPLPGEPPYGVPIFGTSIMPAIFLLGMFYDIKRVLEKQGYGRLDVTIFPEKIVEKLGENATPDEKYAAIEQFLNDVQETLDVLGPDDVFSHTDDAQVNRAPGAGGEAGLLAGTDRLIVVMERQLVKALKTMPLLMAVAEGVSEANANRQWEIYGKGITQLQQQIENVVGYLLEVGLQSEGIATNVRLRFAEVRVIDAYREAQTQLQKLQVAMQSEDRLYITADEAADYVWGHGIPADLVEKKIAQADAPPAIPAPPEPDVPEPGANRLVRGITPEGADQGFSGLPDGVTAMDVQNTIAWWDESVPLGAGVLESDVVEE